TTRSSRAMPTWPRPPTSCTSRSPRTGSAASSPRPERARPGSAPRACQPQDQCEGPFRSRPELADERLAAGAEDVAKHERDDDRVVELPGDRDEVGNEVEGQREVADEREQKQLVPARDARVVREPGDEDDAVGDEGRERAGIASPARDDERDHR